MIRFILMLALLAAFPALSTDMYLPSLPYLQKIWDKPLAVINLTLILFFIFYCISLLVYGPLSDRFGRRPPLMAGITTYIIGSILCGLSQSALMLILARIIQAAGAASASSISLAMTKDRLPPAYRERILGYIAVIMALAPMAAPMIGSLVLTRLSWHWIFAVQAMLGLIALISVFFTPESNLSPQGVSIKDLLKSYSRLLRNKDFMLIVLCTSLTGVSFFGFIASCSTIYISDYHTTETEFSLFFGANALSFMIGAIVCSRFGRKIGTSVMMTSGFAGIAFGGVLMISKIIPGPYALAVPMGIISFSLGVSRPPSNNLALEQVRKDAGTASSILVFIYFIMGAVGMAAVSFDWGDKVVFLGILGAITGLITLFTWLLIKSKVKIP